jgi:predicted nuclease of predicted toxin-antitoxin system
VKLKLDENLSERGRALLAASGHDVSTVTLQGLQSATDDALIEICQREGRAIVTLDLDFANPMRFHPGEYPGIAVLRLSAQR